MPKPNKKRPGPTPGRRGRKPGVSRKTINIEDLLSPDPKIRKQANRDIFWGDTPDEVRHALSSLKYLSRYVERCGSIADQVSRDAAIIAGGILPNDQKVKLSTWADMAAHESRCLVQSLLDAFERADGSFLRRLASAIETPPGDREFQGVIQFLEIINPNDLKKAAEQKSIEIDGDLPPSLQKFVIDGRAQFVPFLQAWLKEKEIVLGQPAIRKILNQLGASRRHAQLKK